MVLKSEPIGPANYRMITSIELSNFRCYKDLKIENVSGLNVIVGDNGTGKTALLEAIFLALASASEVGIRYRSMRGLDSSFSGTQNRVEDALFGDLFNNYNLSKPVVISLAGDGPEQRTLRIFRGQSEVSLPLGIDDSASRSGGFNFEWTDANKRTHLAKPSIISGRVNLPETGEDLPSFFYFGSTAPIGSLENASRFSDLSKKNEHHNFIKALTSEYSWIKDISLEISGGSAAMYATLEGTSFKIPLPNVSSGINRVIGIMLAIASQKRSIVLIDEIENGIFYTHQKAIWRALLQFMRQSESQLIVTTHSRECLEALIEAAGSETSDISLLKIERNGSDQPEIFQFAGKDLKIGIEQGAEIRGGTE